MPPDDGRWGPADGNRSAPQQERRQYAPKMAQELVVAETAAVEAQLTVMAETINTMLPSHIDPAVFRRVVIVAVQRNNDLLLPEHRQSLFLAAQQAAVDGLLPDGREGVFIVRWDEKARKQQICWQPMVWGLVTAARRAGLRNISAHIVYEGEPFEIVLGDEETIHHRRVPECAEKGLDAAVLVYAIATMADGTKVRRHMLASRVRKIKAAAKAKTGPWFGPYEDEQWIKTSLRFLSKWLDLSSQGDGAVRFRSALERVDSLSEITVDAEGEDDGGAVMEQGPQPALAAPQDKLSTLEESLRPKEAVPVDKPVEQVDRPQVQTADTLPTTDKLPDHAAARQFADWMLKCIQECPTHDKIAEFFQMKKCAAAVKRFKTDYPALAKEILDAQINRSLQLSKEMDRVPSSRR